MRNVELLTVVARIHPEIWDAIIPQGPVLGRDADRVALNPQPLPPGPPEQMLLRGAAEMVHELVSLAIQSEITGKSSSRFVSDLIDDWCATPWPHKWPWPVPGPRPAEGPSPQPWNDGPSPEPWAEAAAKVVGAIVLAMMGDRLAGSELGTTLSEGAERLTDAAGSG